jgi:uncharacterized sulfatase
MDEQLGVLFDYIRSNDELRDNTLIVMCSDNGPEPGAGSAGPFRGHKTMLYEGGIRSPLVVWGPGLVEAGSRGAVNQASILAAIDLVPSLLAVAGLGEQVDPACDGEPLPDVLLGKSKASRTRPLYFRRPPDRDVFYGIDNLPDLAIRHKKWKLLCEYDGTAVQLYDLEADRGETNDVSRENPEVVQRLKNQLVAWHESMPPDNGPALRGKQQGRKKLGK